MSKMNRERERDKETRVKVHDLLKAPFGRASLAASGAVWSRFLPNGVK